MPLKPPIFIIGSMRAGKSTLAAVVAELGGMCTWMEPSILLATGHALRRTDVATAADAKPWARHHMQRKVLRYQQEHDDARVIIEGPSATLKIPFLHAVFPDAKFIHIFRDGRVVIRERALDEQINRQFAMVSSSTFDRAREQLGLMNWRDLPGLPMKVSRTLVGRMSKRRWYGPRYPGWQHDRHKSADEIATRQWAMFIEHALTELPKLPPGAWTDVRCEALVANPAAELRRLVDVCNLAADADQIAKLAESMRARAALWQPGSIDDPAIQPLVPIMRPQLERLGYLTASMKT